MMVSGSTRCTHSWSDTGRRRGNRDHSRTVCTRPTGSNSGDGLYRFQPPSCRIFGTYTGCRRWVSLGHSCIHDTDCTLHHHSSTVRGNLGSVSGSIVFHRTSTPFVRICDLSLSPICPDLGTHIERSTLSEKTRSLNPCISLHNADKRQSTWNGRYRRSPFGTP